MISKILKIKGVGKFKDYSNNGDDELRFLKNTIIFGYNTYGKSTLTTIFRSLQLSDKKYLLGKKSFNYSDDAVVDILDSDNEHSTLVNGKWTNSNISIFDNHFINNSIYVGDEIDYRHRSTLHGIFVGENIGPKLTKLGELRADQELLEQNRDKVKLKYKNQNLGTFEEFLKVKIVANTDKKIKEKKDEVNRLKNISDLKKIISTSPLTSEFKELSESIQKALDTSAEKNIEVHIKNHWRTIDASRNFLADGVSLLKDERKNCVFCGQKLDQVTELIDDLKKVFGSSYEQTRQEIKINGEAFLRFDIEAEVSKFIPLGVNCYDLFDKKILLKNKSLIDQEIKTKLTNLNHKIDCESEKSPFRIFVTEIKRLHPTFEKIKLLEFSVVKQMSLESELKELELSQYRHSNDGNELANEYKDFVEKIEEKKNEINTLRTKIGSITEKVIGQNQVTINKVLKDLLKADFTIEKLSSKSNLSRLDSHFIDYELSFSGCSVPISNKHSQYDEEPIDKSYFGNTLSDSDKRLLAIAFFITTLLNDQNLKDKIVILDDPFSSFDSNRKDHLANAIVNIKNESGEKPEQTIILTHDSSFLARMIEKIPSPETRILEIDYSLSAGSSLIACNVDDLTEEQYFKDIKSIRDSVERSINIDESLVKVRKCLERILRHKYFFSLDKSTINDGSINSYLEKIDGKCSIKDEILKNNWHEPMHDQHMIMKLEKPEKIEKLKEFLLLLEKI